MKITLIAFAMLIATAMSVSIETQEKGRNFQKNTNLDLNIELEKRRYGAVYAKPQDTTARGWNGANPMYPSHHFRYNKNGTLNLNKAHWNQTTSSSDDKKHNKNIKKVDIKAFAVEKKFNNKRFHNKKSFSKSESKDGKKFMNKRVMNKKDSKSESKDGKRMNKNFVAKKVVVGDAN